MQLVIELLDDHGRPLSDNSAMRLVASMLADGTDDMFGCLELADMEGRAILARVKGRVEEPGGCDSPYEIMELDLPGTAALSATVIGRVGDLLAGE